MFSLFMRSSIVQLFFTTDFKPRLDRRFEPFPVHVRREIRTSCNRIELHDISSDIHFEQCLLFYIEFEMEQLIYLVDDSPWTSYRKFFHD